MGGHDGIDILYQFTMLDWINLEEILSFCLTENNIINLPQIELLYLAHRK